MAQRDSSNGRAEDPSHGEPSQDPWRAFSYVVTGVLLYGLVGWGLDRWLGTTYLVGIGIAVGAALGLYLTWKAFQPPRDHQDERPNSTS